MQSRYRILFLVALFFFSACGPKRIISTAPVRVETADELFLRAEKMLQLKSYKTALAIYDEYLSRFPDKPLAAAVLMKTGAIYAILGNNEKARYAYDRLVNEYPDSPLAFDARVERLATYYNEGQYQEVIKQAHFLLEQKVPDRNTFRTYILLGDTYLATGSIDAAVCVYISAYSKFKDLEKESLLEKLNQALKQLSARDVASVLEQLEDDQSKGDFIYLLGVSKAKEEYDEEINVLSEFIEKYPEHEMALSAKNLVDELSKKAVYSRYTIGCVLPLSGPYKTYGNLALKGIELALAQFSSRAGTNPSIKIIIKDTGSDPDKAAIAVRELFKEHVAAIIGPIITAEPAALEAQLRGIPIITLTQKDNITDIGDYVFRNFLTPAMQTKAIVSYAINTLGLKSFAILYPDENYGKTYMNLFWDEVIACGGKVVGVESYNVDQTDFADPIKKLAGFYYKAPEDLINLPIQVTDEEKKIVAEESYRNKEPGLMIDFDALFIPDAPNKVGLIVPQLAFYDIKNTCLLGTNLWHSNSLIKMSRKYVQGAILTDGFFEDSSFKYVKEFVKNFEEVFKEKPGFIEAVSYDTAMILFQKISRPDIRFRSAIKDELMNLSDFQGLTGITSFDKNREVHKKLFLLQIKGDKFVELKFK